MSAIVQVGSRWTGLEGLKHLIIFGDSYSQVGYDSTAPHPTLDNPLGVPHPGVTWNEPDLPNWVGHLITRYASNPLLIYDYARGGATLSGVRTQIEQEFLRHLAKRPKWAQWSETDTLFITWVGINDCAFATSETTPQLVHKLFDMQEGLYGAGARNFLLIDLPPINRSPAAKASAIMQSPERMSSNESWNIHLREGAARFASSHAESTVLIYSSWDTFSRVLDNPATFGFGRDDARKAAGTIWFDRLHPTSKMHDLVAHELADFLRGVAPYAAPVNESGVTYEHSTGSTNSCSGCTCQ